MNRDDTRALLSTVVEFGNVLAEAALVTAERAAGRNDPETAMAFLQFAHLIEFYGKQVRSLLEPSPAP